MSSLDRVDSLKQRHEALERAIHDETTRPSPNEDVLHQLKKKKLRIKDEIVDLTRH